MKTIFLTCLLAMFAVADEPASGTHKAVLSGWQEVPVVLTAATGEVTVESLANPVRMKVTLKYENLSDKATAAHLHMAQRGVNAPPVVFLCGGTRPACPEKSGTVEVTIAEADVLAQAAQGLDAGALTGLLEAIQNGAVYANVHSAKFPNGEIRGQLGRGFRGAGMDGDDDDDDGRGKPENPGQGNGNGNDKDKDKDRGKGKGNG